MVARRWLSVGTAIALLMAGAAGCGVPSAASPIAADAPTATSSDTPTETAVAAELAATERPPSNAETPVLTNEPAAEPTAPPQPQRPPADRSVTKPGDAEKITWDDVNLGMQADVVFRPFMISDRVKELEGKRISIIGYMHGGQAGQRGIKEFILLKNTQCKFGPGGQADHLADVKLKADSSVLFTPSPIKVEGTLVLEPFQGPDGNTWSIYRLEAAQVRN
jgi:hypothetical protein